jgi:hypothetical protein
MKAALMFLLGVAVGWVLLPTRRPATPLSAGGWPETLTWTADGWSVEAATWS